MDGRAPKSASDPAAQTVAATAGIRAKIPTAAPLAKPGGRRIRS
jgi:hypothetical protein